MSLKFKIIICVLTLLSVSLFSQTTNTKIYARYFIKQNKILFRIAPANKTVFEKIKNQSLQITKSLFINGKESEEQILIKNLMVYNIADTLNWGNLFKKDSNKAAFIYQTLYNNNATGNNSASEKTTNESMLFNLLLLSCDFDKDIAEACGLFFSDSIANNTQQYVYKIKLNIANSKTETLLTLNINSSELSKDPVLNTLALKTKNKIATLIWEAKSQENYFSGYNIEKSEDSIVFKKINTSPQILLTNQFEKNKTKIYFQDTMKIPNKKYFYRLKGINFFGEESSASNIVTAYAYPEIKTTPVIDSINILNNKHVLIHWQMENKTENNLPIAYVLMHSEKDKGNYTVIHKAKSTFRYTHLTPSSHNYYKVGAITETSDTLFSFSRMASINDTIPPESPVALSASVNSKGDVLFTWNKNLESDLQGYKLFKANHPNEEFIQLNNTFITDTFYQYKMNLNVLNKKIYFKIAASDLNYNTSNLSKAISVTIPDTIPPSAPQILQITSKQNTVFIKGINSLSEDVKQHVLLRKTESEPDFLTVQTKSFKDTGFVYIDTTATQGLIYYYQIAAIDSSENKSQSIIFPYKHETGYREKITTFKSSVNRETKSIFLSWKYEQAKIEKFILYRKNKNEALTIIKTLNGNILNYEDKTPNIGNIYGYRIKAVMENGTESIISNELVVDF